MRLILLILSLIGLAVAPLAPAGATVSQHCSSAMTSGQPTDHHQGKVMAVDRCCAVAAALPFNQEAPGLDRMDPLPLDDFAPPALTGIIPYGDDPPPRS